MRDSLFKTTRSAILVAISGFRPTGKAQREACRLDQIDPDVHLDAGVVMDDRFICMADCARDLRNHIQAVSHELGLMIAENGDAIDPANIGIKVRLHELVEQTGRLRGQLDLAVDATQAAWDSFNTDFSTQCDDLRAGLLAAHQCVADNAV